MKIKLITIMILIMIIMSVLIINYNSVQSISTERQIRQAPRSSDDFEMDMKISTVSSASFWGEAAGDAPKSNPHEISNNIPKPLSNGGINWSSIEVLSEPVFGQNFNNRSSFGPDIEVEDGKIYVVWTDSNNTNGAGNDRDIFFRYFDGNIWSEVQVISEPIRGQDINNRNSSGPRIAVENGKIYVVWCDENNTYGAGTDMDIFFRCNITGDRWEDVQVISEPVVGQNFNNLSSRDQNIAVENGKIYVTWADTNNTNGAGTDFDIFYRCNLTGTSWEDVQVISEPVVGQDFNTARSWRGDMAVKNGNIYVVWDDRNNTNGAGTDRDVFYRCNSTGSGWEDIQVISEPIFGFNSNGPRSFLPEITVDNSKIYVVWIDGNAANNNAGLDNDIFFRCNIIGTGWEQIQVISEPVPGQNFNTGGSGSSDVAVENGKVFIVWADENNTNSAGTDYDIFYRCNITGFSWESIQVISEPVPGQDFNNQSSKLPRIAVENGKIYVVWNDNNNTNGAGTDGDVFHRWKQVPSLLLRSPKVTPSVGNTSTEFNFTVTYYQYYNKAPTEIQVIIDGAEHSMLEVDQTDTNCTNGKKYYFSIKNLDIGSHTYEFNSSDGFNYTNTKLFHNLEVFNTLPQIITENNLTAIEDEYYKIIYEFKDIDIANVGQSCHWEFATNASWLNFDLITGELNGTPENDEVGEYWVYIAVNDMIDIIDTNFTLTVIDVNDNPIIITNNVKVTNEDELYEVDYSATDIDSLIGNQIWFLETNATSWLNISSSSGILNGTPTNDDVGKYWVNVSVNDAEGGFGFTNYTLTVLNVNDKPEIITVDILITETDKLYEVQYNATDIDSPISQFTWTLNTNATWLQIDSSTGLLSGIPTRDYAGWYNVNVTVSDGDSGSDWHEFMLTVIKGNLPPIITTVDVETATVNKSYEVDYNATDDKTFWLSWSLKSNASWLSLDSTTGVLSGTPTINYGGKQYWINISVSDGNFAWDYHNFTLTVLKESEIIMKNNIPKLSNFELTPAEGDTDTEFIFSVHYFDIDNETPEIIQVVIDGNIYDMNLEYGGIAYNGKYEYKTTLSEGQHTYYFTASDGSDINTSDTLSTPYIEKLAEIDGDGTRKEGTSWEWLISVIVIVVIVVVIIAFLIIRRKKKAEQEIIQPAQYEIPTSDFEPTPALFPEQFPSPIQDQILAPPDTWAPVQETEMQEPSFQGDIYYTPPQEQETIATTPEDTTLIEPPIQPETLEQPEQPVGEEDMKELEE